MPVHPHRLCFTRTCPGLPGSLASHPVALRSFPRPRPARCASSSRRFRCCPRSAKDEGASNGYFGALCASLHHPLCTLHDLRCRMPCNTRFRLADCAFTGRESNPLACDERFLAHRFPLSRACPGAIAASLPHTIHDRSDQPAHTHDPVEQKQGAALAPAVVDTAVAITAITRLVLRPWRQWASEKKRAYQCTE